MTALLAAEWLKIRSVRSTAWTVGLFLLLSTGLAYLVGVTASAGYENAPPDRQAQWDPIMLTFYGMLIAQLALVVLAVFIVTSEYSTGTIRGSLAATPKRGRFFAAKVGAGAVFAAAVGLVTVGATFAAAQAGMGEHGASPTDDGVLQASAGAVLYLVLIFLISLGLAAVLRSAIATLAILMPLFFLGSQGLGMIPAIREYGQFLPDQAGMLIMHIAPPPDPTFIRPYGPWGGIGIMALWAVVALLGGYAAVRRRDA